jgi:hypothetical protein
VAKVRIDASNVRGLAEKLKAATEKLQVGWFEGAKYSDNTPVAGVAALNEFGSKTAPARPFFRPAIADNQGKWAEIYADRAKQWIGGSGAYAGVLTTVGLVAEADVKDAIVSGDHLALSPVTLALRRLRNDGVPIGGKVVGMVASAVAQGKTGAGELGQPFSNQDPLRETGYMIATLTHEVTS